MRLLECKKVIINKIMAIEKTCDRFEWFTRREF